MKNILIGFTLAVISFVAYELLNILVITLTANDEVEPPTDYLKEVR